MIYKCPASDLQWWLKERYGNYAYNNELSGYRETGRSNLIVMADGAENPATPGEARYWFNSSTYLDRINFPLHTRKANSLFNDSHVESLKKTIIESKMLIP
jgi:prepilin-type processing-associated H-X9-DG protein